MERFLEVLGHLGSLVFALALLAGATLLAIGREPVLLVWGALLLAVPVGLAAGFGAIKVLRVFLFKWKEESGE